MDSLGMQSEVLLVDRLFKYAVTGIAGGLAL